MTKGISPQVVNATVWRADVNQGDPLTLLGSRSTSISTVLAHAVARSGL
jgi:hypothetical protein